ncbi:MAG: hypothetical protein PVH50_10880, partial [Anaerolineae bacterium]
NAWLSYGRCQRHAEPRGIFLQPTLDAVFLRDQSVYSQGGKERAGSTGVAGQGAYLCVAH